MIRLPCYILSDRKAAISSLSIAALFKKSNNINKQVEIIAQGFLSNLTGYREIETSQIIIEIQNIKWNY